MNDRLYRSVDDRVIAGVCGGLAVRMAIDPSLVRIAYAVLALVTGIFPLLILYVIMAAVVPEEPTGFAGVGRSPTPPGPDAVPGWAPPSADATWPGTAAAAPGETPAPVAFAGEPETGVPASDAPGAGTGVGQPIPNALATPPVPPAAAQPQWATPRDARRARRERRSSDPLLAVVGGLVLVGLGVYFLVRDQLTVDWGVVWAAGLVALGVVVVVAAFVRPRR
jgi:phage shock protein C